MKAIMNPPTLQWNLLMRKMNHQANLLLLASHHPVLPTIKRRDPTEALVLDLTIACLTEDGRSCKKLLSSFLGIHAS
jgi:hypothetical protein